MKRNGLWKISSRRNTNLINSANNSLENPYDKKIKEMELKKLVNYR